MGSDGRAGTVLGTTIGKHRISRLIGSGVTGRVFACTGPDDRPVAIKVLRSAHASIGERMFRDRLLLEKIQSPYVAQIFDVAMFNNAPYVVMELVEGESLAEQLKKGRMRTVDALSIAREIAEGLMAAWAHGIAHGDLRPKNVLMRDGHVKIVDFMLAPPVEGTDSLRGMPSYMAPELLVGTPPDALSDIYALGCSLFEILVGKPPYTGNPATVLHFQAHEAPPSLERELPGAPQFLVDLLGRLLEKDRARRLKTWTEVLTAIDRALQGASMPALAKPQIPELDVEMDIDGEDEGYDEKTAEIHSSPARDDLLSSLGDEDAVATLSGEDKVPTSPERPPYKPAPKAVPQPAFLDEIADAQTRLRPMESPKKSPPSDEVLFESNDDVFDLDGDDPETIQLRAGAADTLELGDDDGEATRVAPEIAKPAPMAVKSLDPAPVEEEFEEVNMEATRIGVDMSAAPPPVLQSSRPQAVPSPAPVEITNVSVDAPETSAETFGVYRSKSSKSVVEMSPLLADAGADDLLIDDSSADDGVVFDAEGDGDAFDAEDGGDVFGGAEEEFVPDDPMTDDVITDVKTGIARKPQPGFSRSEIEDVLDDPSTQMALAEDSFEDPTSAQQGIAPAVLPVVPVSAADIGLVLQPANAEDLGISLQPVDDTSHADGGEINDDYAGLAPLDTDFLSAPLQPDPPPVLPVMPGGLPRKKP